MELQNSRIQSPILFELEDELALRTGRPQSVMDAIARLREWTGTEPYLIALLSHQLIECLPLVVGGEEKQLIDELVQRKIVEDWRQNTAAAHLCKIESTLLSYPQVDSLLILYLKALQRGETEVEDSAEQAALIAAGLVVQEGDMLKVANAVYAAVFDLNWIEQQVPGLTKPVTISRSGVWPVEGSRRLKQATKKAPAHTTVDQQDQPMLETKLYSKAMVLACCMAVVVAVLTAYTRESEQPSLAADGPAEVGLVQDETVALGGGSAIASLPEKQLFDSGTDHATNGRWLRVMRAFCQIPDSSAYFEPAKRNMEKWIRLYGEDIDAAKIAFENERTESCSIMP